MKKHILVVWPVVREDWVEVFRQLSDNFRFTFLAGIFPDNDKPNYVQGFARCVYWSQFSSCVDIIARLNPDKVIFMTIDTGLAIVLNYTLKQNKIPTYILQHGIYTNYKDYRIREKMWRKKRIQKSVQIHKKEIGFSTLRFIHNSIKIPQKWIFIPLFIFLFAQRRKGAYWASKYMTFRAKKPDYYICYSSYNATIHKELDKIKDDRIIYVGSPELDLYLEPKNKVAQEPYYLHIDQSFAENSFGEETVSKSEMIKFYHKLNAFCKRQKARLYIKLHPESYNSTWLPNDENIKYLRRTPNFNEVIQSAKGCFGFYSTMIVPAAYWSNIILFRLFYSGLQEKLVKLNSVSILDFWTFKDSDILFKERFEISPDLIADFFYSSDGKSLERIMNVLNV